MQPRPLVLLFLPLPKPGLPQCSPPATDTANSVAGVLTPGVTASLCRRLRLRWCLGTSSCKSESSLRLLAVAAASAVPRHSSRQSCARRDQQTVARQCAGERSSSSQAFSVWKAMSRKPSLTCGYPAQDCTVSDSRTLKPNNRPGARGLFIYYNFIFFVVNFVQAKCQTVSGRWLLLLHSGGPPPPTVWCEVRRRLGMVQRVVPGSRRGRQSWR